MKDPRPYQRQAIDAWWKKLPAAGLIVIPTAGGKSLIIAQLIKEIRGKYKSRILCLSHVKELIQQNQIEYGGDDSGIFSAGLGKKELQAPVLFASIQSLEKHIHKLFPAPEIVIIDEVHLVSRKENARYNKVLKLLKIMYPHLRIIGLSATPYRLDSGWLHKGDGALFDSIIYEIGPQELIDQGYLSPITTKSGSLTIDTSGVHHRGKEFIESELEQAAMSGDTTELAISDVLKRAIGRKKWLIFACGIKHAEQINDCLIAHQIKSKVVTGKTADRDQIIIDYKKDLIQCIVNVDILTTGFNCPQIDLLVFLRPTESSGLFVQMIGRSMRLSPGKIDALILDYAGNCMRHGPIDAINPDKKPSDGNGIAPCKICPECESVIPAGMRECPDCGYIFPPQEKPIQEVPDELPILKSQIEPETLPVDDMICKVHSRPGKKECVRITYRCGMTWIDEYQHPLSANRWWFEQFCYHAGLPKNIETAQEFMNYKPKTPAKITVKPKGKYYEIINRLY